MTRLDLVLFIAASTSWLLDSGFLASCASRTKLLDRSGRDAADELPGKDQIKNDRR
jgi:hypothetical protein